MDSVWCYADVSGALRSDVVFVNDEEFLQREAFIHRDSSMCLDLSDILW